jgi:hypothetical protein
MELIFMRRDNHVLQGAIFEDETVYGADGAAANVNHVNRTL